MYYRFRDSNKNSKIVVRINDTGQDLENKSHFVSNFLRYLAIHAKKLFSNTTINSD